VDAKRLGFSDAQIEYLTGSKPEPLQPVYKGVDTCAAEFEAYTPYYYSTYRTRTKPRRTLATP